MRYKLALIAVVTLFLMPLPRASAQGCSLCYTQARSSGPKMIRALQDGIAILMVPPLGICGLIIFMAYKKRNKFSKQLDPGEHDGSSNNLGW